MKRFNVTGICVPAKHYMVDIKDKLIQIKKLIDEESYFTINKARQYGKTTTLYELRRYLQGEYLVIKISNEIISMANTYGMIANKNGITAVSNRIYEIIIYDYFISKDKTNCIDKGLE